MVALLLLGLAAITRIETATAANALLAAEARQNALLALHVAVGRLQRFAGPDQRTTARADILSESVGNPYWTGVWDAASAGRAPLTWLVSGNETDALAFTPDLPQATDPAPGNDSVWLLRTPAGSAAAGIKLERRAVSAVGLPGCDGAHIAGHYAWWVGDEGIKAKFNLANAYAGEAAGAAQNLLEFMSAQQFGIEQLADGFGAYVAAKGSTASGENLRAKLGRVLVPEQIVYADSSFGLTTVRDRFHDLTTCSLGVLANVASGGLKKDLTRGLEAKATVFCRRRLADSAERPLARPARRSPCCCACAGGLGVRPSRRKTPSVVPADGGTGQSLQRCTCAGGLPAGVAPERSD
jgi:hypothetical protein